MKIQVMAAFVVAACGGGGGSSDDGTTDSTTVPAMVNVSGVASEVGLGGRTPVANVVVEAYRNGNDTTVVASATTNASGMYTIVIPTDGGPLDGYLLAKHSPHKNTYLYPPGPLAADTTAATVLLLTQGTFETVATFAQASQPAGKGWIGVMVVDAANNPVAGATISSMPAGTIRYNNASGFPTGIGQASVTGADGIGYVFNVAPGTVNVSAAKAGSTFRAHDVNARADQVTTTLIQ